MATSTLALRNATARLSSQASRDLSGVWRSADTAAKASTALRDVLPALVGEYGSAAAVLASNWYDELREGKGVGGSFEAIVAEIEDSGEDALVGWALDEATDFAAFQGLILGGMQRRIANFSRQTITESSIADPRARGWVRVGNGGCDWCAQYLDGEVHAVEYDFQAHDHCNCGAAPAW